MARKKTKEAKEWHENPETECMCIRCNHTWKLGESISCPNCEGLI